MITTCFIAKHGVLRAGGGKENEKRVLAGSITTKHYKGNGTVW